MNIIDWIVMISVLVLMLAYGVYVSYGKKSRQTYLKGGNQTPWYLVLIGVMATQASAITFVAEPGQSYIDGMRFVQYYFGMPLAMIVICITFIPIFQKLNVYTAYQYLEHRFDKRTRALTSFLFLLSRGLATGVSIYAPSIILSSILNWNIYLTNVLMGGILLIYTYIGGAKAVAQTQKIQFLIILASMAFAGFLAVKNLPGASFGDALYLAGKAGKLNVINTKFDWKDKYNIWSGLIGGFFLALSYFGTDQSQVGRYISAKDTTNSRMGLLLNGIVKIPMQFAILLIGALLFTLYSLKSGPVYFNENAYEELKVISPAEANVLETEHAQLEKQLQNESKYLLQLRKQHTSKEAENSAITSYKTTQQQLRALHLRTQDAINKENLSPEKTDTNYIFLYFVKHSLPVGLIGLLFAAIFLADWGSTSAALNSLAVSSLIDVHLLLFNKKNISDKMQLKYGRIHTLFWGIFCIFVAFIASKMGSLIEAVNVLGSLFYGTILGIFLTAFYLKHISSKAIFPAIIIAQIIVLIVFYLKIVSFLWLNVIGTFSVIIFALILNKLMFQKG